MTKKGLPHDNREQSFTYKPIKYKYNEKTHYTRAIKSFILWLLSRKRSVKINIQFAVIYAILFYTHIRIRSIFTVLESSIYERNKILHLLYSTYSR